MTFLDPNGRPLVRPIVMAGPCVAESYELMKEVCQFMVPLSQELGFHFIFKASFDKANRTSIDSYRGPGLEQAMQWFGRLKGEFSGLEVLTDIHETVQVQPVARVCDWLQIPAFLCRQTDLIIAAVESGRSVNIKKGQFMAPEGTHHLAEKVRAICNKRGQPVRLALTERGSTFGYGDYVVDMRSFSVMSKAGAHVIFDGTHSVQRPGEGKGGAVSGGDRMHIPALARAATATGYLDGYFFEMHADPSQAKSDGATILSFARIESLLRQIVPFWKECLALSRIDQDFVDRPALTPMPTKRG